MRLNGVVRLCPADRTVKGPHSSYGDTAPALSQPFARQPALLQREADVPEAEAARLVGVALGVVGVITERSRRMGAVSSWSGRGRPGCGRGVETA